MQRNKEQSPQVSPEGFSFTENEILFDRISAKRLETLIYDDRTIIHTAKVDSNNYGEFVFITATRGQDTYTFWGLGLHEPRDRWLVDEWRFHRANRHPSTLNRRISAPEVQRLIQERQVAITPDVESHTQSDHGELFEMLADLTDDDGALSDMDDLGWMLAGLE